MGRLLRIYAVPSIISMLVNALYNIVDQIFIGWGVGYLGNGATNIIFPITIVFAAFALMFGDGSAAYMSLKLGASKRDEAASGVANGIILSIATSGVLTVIVFAIFPRLLSLFGCTAELEPYAREYGYIIIIGLPFQTVCATVNSVIRADGSPKYAMFSMMSGALLNVVLDPIFIFLFDMGVKGAAIATVISQVVSFLLNVLYLRRLKSIGLKGSFKLSLPIASKVASLGISSFITQIFAALIMGLQNNLLRSQGHLSAYGSEIPITVTGIVVKVNEILNSVFLGIAVGAQPIISYNYGAGNADRVRHAFRLQVLCTTTFSVVLWLAVQCFPDVFIKIFNNACIYKRLREAASPGVKYIRCRSGGQSGFQLCFVCIIISLVFFDRNLRMCFLILL